MHTFFLRQTNEGLTCLTPHLVVYRMEPKGIKLSQEVLGIKHANETKCQILKVICPHIY